MIIRKRYLIITAASIVVGCSMFGSNNSMNTVNTIPLPPEKIAPADAVMPANPAQIRSSESKPAASTPTAATGTKYQRYMHENRTNGQVTQIKVDTGKDLPDYYMYPSQQQNSNNNDSNPNRNLSTPSWQISW